MAKISIKKKNIPKKKSIKNKKNQKTRNNKKSNKKSNNKKKGGSSYSLNNIDFSQEFNNMILRQEEFLSKYIMEPPGRSDQGTLFKSIRSGGAFTNKLDTNGKFINNIDLEELFINTKIYYNLAKLTRDYVMSFMSPETNVEFINKKIKVYRFIQVSDYQKGYLQPIPISCTWNIDFSKEWAGERNCCILEIYIDLYSLFISTSLPFFGIDPKATFYDYTNSNNPKRLFILNQSQYEVILPPCVIIPISLREEPSYNGSIKVVSCEAYQLDENSLDNAFKIVKQNGVLFDPSNQSQLEYLMLNLKFN